MKQAAEPPASKNNAGKDILHIQLCYCKLTANTVFALVIILSIIFHILAFEHHELTKNFLCYCREILKNIILF